MKESWKSILNHKYFTNSLSKIDNKTSIPNTKDKLLKPWSYCEVEDVKIIWVGLSPYKSLSKATGLAFANPPMKDWRTEISSSLSIILDCLANDTNNIVVEEGFDFTLERWAKQGVILANAALTVPSNGTARGHLTIWEKFTESWLVNLDRVRKGITFCLIGKDAAMYADCITNNKVMKFAHPAAVAYRIKDDSIDLRYDFRRQQIFKLNEEYGIKWF